MKTAAKKLTSEQVKQMVDVYLNTNYSAKEVGEQFGVTPSNVVYHANKRRKEEKELNEKNI